MDAVLGVDLENFLALVVVDHLVHAGRAIALRGLVVQWQVVPDRQVRVLQGEVTGLVLLVVGVGQKHRGQLVEAEHAVGLGVVDARAILGRLELGVVGLGIAQGEGQLAVAQVDVDEGERRTDDVAPLVLRRAEVALHMQFLPGPGIFVGGGILAQFIAAAPGAERLGHHFGGHHAGLHRRVRTLDLGEIERAGVVADQQAASEAHLRLRLQAALDDGARAVGDAGAALQVLADHRMVLVALEFVERADVGIAVGQVHDQADGDLVVFQVVEEAAACGAAFVERPAGGVHHQSLMIFSVRNFPYFLDSYSIMLRVFALIETEAGDQLLAEMAPAALREQGVFGVQFHSRGVAVLVLAMDADAHVAGGDALGGAIVVEQHFGGGKARKDFHAEPLGLGRQPAAQVAEADDVVAFVVHGFGYEQAGYPDPALGAAQDVDVVLGDRGEQRRLARLPVGEQFVEGGGFEDRAGEDVGADLGAFLHDADRQRIVQLAEAAGCGESGRAGAHDDHVVFHEFPAHSPPRPIAKARF